MKTRVLTAVVFLACSTAAMASGVRKTYLIQQHFPLAANGTLILENMTGNVEVLVGEGTGVHVDAQKTIFAKDADGIEEGRELTALTVGGNEVTRVLRSAIGTARKRSWSSTVNWRLRIPRTANVRVSNGSGNFVRIFNVQGNVYVKNFDGAISFENLGGSVTADSANGSISIDVVRMRSDIRLVTVNGHITVRISPEIDLRWVAQTLRGDIRTNLPVRGMTNGATFRGSVNAPGGPTLSTTSLLGNIHLLGAGVPLQTAQSVRRNPDIAWSGPGQRTQKVGSWRQAVVEGPLKYDTTLGDVHVREVRGGANVTTGAGQVQLGTVAGDATVISKGGALELGEILGTLKASTHAGDILVEAARRGGTIDTTGGTIRLLYTGGPTRLLSGGGDIVVRQAAGSINAETRSGDINVTIDRNAKHLRVDARTAKGNILLNVPEGFGADVELTLVTSDAAAHTIQSDLPGLSISREQAGEGRTLVRARGKLNGGGEPVTLFATEGSIRIMSGPVGPVLFGR